LEGKGRRATKSGQSAAIKSGGNEKSHEWFIRRDQQRYGL
jgi:hypothetical protein